MDVKKITINIFSNWTNLVLSVVIAFVVSPIIVHNLGNELYGIWVIIVSITGYFTILDFGVNTAIVRFISMYSAQENKQKANEIYSTAFIFFIIVSFFVILATAILGVYFKKFFNIQSLPDSYLYFVLIIIATDMAFGLIFSVLLGTLSALQEYLKINIVSITTSLMKNIVLVIMLLNGYKIMTLALIQLSASAVRYSLQYLIVKRNYGFFKFKLSNCSKSTLKQIYNYSIYSFVISITLKILFYTDSLVIGSLITVSEVAFYAIPATILDYLEKMVWAMFAVLIPVVSSRDAVGDTDKNKSIYLVGTKYSLLLSLPIILVLFTAGDDFIRLWMGPEYGTKSDWVLKILLIGYFFSLSQLVAHGILKGISRHKILAYILSAEAICNLLISISLAKPLGIEGVALGTTVPLILFSLLIPFYTCRVLKMNLGLYLMNSYFAPLLMIITFTSIYYFFPIEIVNYGQLILYASFVTFLIWSLSLFFIVEASHRELLFKKVQSWL